VQLAEANALIKLVHITVGIYLWEFVLNFDYEYSLITGKRKLNRTVPLYLGCRWFTLLAVIFQLVGFDEPGKLNCEALLITAFVFAYFSFLCASGLIILRIYALWEHRRIILAVISVVWLANSAAFVYNMAITRAQQIGNFCEVDHIVDIRVTATSTLVTDFTFLALMLVGILRWKKARMMGGIWRVMYQQGLIWVVIVTIADVPPVIFLALNLNEPMDQMFMVPGMVMMSIGALRMYRSLVDGAVLNTTVVGVSAKALSPKSELKFASPSHMSGRDEDTRIGNGGLLDTIGSNTNSHRIVFNTTKDDEESLHHEGRQSTETA